MVDPLESIDGNIAIGSKKKPGGLDHTNTLPNSRHIYLAGGNGREGTGPTVLSPGRNYYFHKRGTKKRGEGKKAKRNRGISDGTELDELREKEWRILAKRWERTVCPHKEG